MKAPTSKEGVAALIEALIPDNSGVTVDTVEVTPWGVVAGFNTDGISIDTSDIVIGAKVSTVSLGEEEFVMTDAIRIEADACDDEEEETPAVIIVGTHSMGESGDDDYCASIYGDIYILCEGGDADAWRAAATVAQDRQMRKSVSAAVASLVEMMSRTSDAALKGIGRKGPVRDLMRRLAAAA